MRNQAAVALLFSELLLALSCSGKAVPNRPVSGTDGAGDGGEAFAPMTDGGEAGVAAVPSVPEAGAGGASGSEPDSPGGAGGEAASPRESLLSLCIDTRDCSEPATCEGFEPLAQRACLLACNSASSCAGDAQCIVVEGQAIGCAPACEWPWDCEVSFDCVDLRHDQRYACVPAEWSTYLLNQ